MGFEEIGREMRILKDHKACFTRHSSLGRDGAFTPRNNVNHAQRQRPDAGRAIRSLFGSKPKTLRDDSDSPVEKLRLGRADGNESDQMMRCKATDARGVISAIGSRREPLSQRSGDLSSPQDPATSYIYRRNGGGMQEMPQEYPAQNYGMARGGQTERQQVREAWEKVTQRTCDPRPLSNLMQGVLARDDAESGTDERGSERNGDRQREIEKNRFVGGAHELLWERDRERERCSAIDSNSDDEFECDRARGAFGRAKEEDGYSHDASIVSSDSASYQKHGGVFGGNPGQGQSSRTTAGATATAYTQRAQGGVVSGRSRAGKEQAPEALAVAMHKLHRLHVENTALKREVQTMREGRQSAAEDKDQYESIQNLLRCQLEEKEKTVSELQTTVSELRSHLRLVQRESDAWQARANELNEEREKMLSEMEDGGHPILEHMDQVVGRLRQDCNSKVEELLKVQNQMMQQQIELRHRDERIKQQDGEIEALNRTISNLRDYVVDTGQYLTRDQPFL